MVVIKFFTVMLGSFLVPYFVWKGTAENYYLAAAAFLTITTISLSVSLDLSDAQKIGKEDSLLLKEAKRLGIKVPIETPN